MAAPWHASRIQVRLTPLELDQLQRLLTHCTGPDHRPPGNRFVDYVVLEEKLADALALATWKRDCHEIELTFDDVQLLTQLVAVPDQASAPQVEMISRMRALTTDTATRLPA